MKLTFIDVTGKPELVEWVQNKETGGKAAIFRMYALEMIGTPLKALMPLADTMLYLNPTVEGDENSRIFDEKYANQLSNFPATKFDLAILLEQLQLKDEVYVVCNYTHPTVGPIVDSLSKYIQQKYTFQGIYLVNDLEDIDEFAASEFDTDEGYEAFVKDIEWMTGQRDEMAEALKK
jgi:hypothetical protein